MSGIHACIPKQANKIEETPHVVGSDNIPLTLIHKKLSFIIDNFFNARTFSAILINLRMATTPLWKTAFCDFPLLIQCLHLMH